ncbi:MAG TPA: GAF domain-containing protein [Pyrinomonadaceae bacterium]
MSLTEKELEELRAASARLAAQYEVTRALAESSDFEEAVPRILRAVCEALGWELGLVWALDREAKSLRFVEAWSAEGRDASEFVRVSRGRTFTRGEPGLPGRVWGMGEPLWVEDLAADATFPRSSLARASGLHAALAFPVLMRGETVAVLEFFSRELRPPDAALLAMMSHVGSQIGQVIERQRAEAERARLREEVIRVQDELLAQLSTPLIPLNPRVVLMPLVGDIDAKRARRMLEALLRGLERTRASVAIIDITGVSNVDAHVADTLVAAARAARLLGTEVILTGIRANVARTLVQLGVELSGLNTRKTLREGIDRALEYLRRETNA